MATKLVRHALELREDNESESYLSRTGGFHASLSVIVTVRKHILQTDLGMRPSMMLAH